MKHLIRSLFISAICLGLPGCAILICMLGDSDISKDTRFKQVVGHEIHTKIKTYLYAPDNRRPDNIRHIYDLSETSGGNEGLTAVMPAGHKVRFDKAVQTNGIGDSAEYLYGEITVKGRTYPVSYYLGTSVYPDGWRRMYDTFVIQE